MMAMSASDGKSGVDWWSSSGCGEDLQKDVVEFGTGRLAGGIAASLPDNICSLFIFFILENIVRKRLFETLS